MRKKISRTIAFQNFADVTIFYNRLLSEIYLGQADTFDRVDATMIIQLEGNLNDAIGMENIIGQLKYQLGTSFMDNASAQAQITSFVNSAFEVNTNWPYQGSKRENYATMILVAYEKE